MLYKLNIFYLCNDFIFLPKKKFFHKLLWRLYIFFNIKKYINIILINRKNIFLLNNKFNNKKCFTDILSFSFICNIKSNKINILGDIFLSPLEIFIRSKNKKIDYLEYFSILIIHGILHLLNFDHKKNYDYIIMNLLEKFFLYKFKKINFKKKMYYDKI